ncbi:MAG: AsnC family transcriptional regulator [Candidatus Micrarchaeia archaeon]|jgi:Lrp/AsnC family leucine-responsive transcriptional regulator
MPKNIYKLDEYDRRILYELDIDSRMPLSRLAKKVRRSKQFVLYRQKRLEEAGVIQAYNAIVDMSRLGYFSFRLYFRFQHMTEKDVAGMVEEIKSLPNVWAVTFLQGKWDLAVFLGARSAVGVHRAWDMILEKYKRNIEAYNLAIYAPVYNFNRTFFLEKERDVVERVYGGSEMVEIGRDCARVLEVYARDVRQPLTAIAKKLSMPPGAVRRKIIELEKKRVICGYKLVFGMGRMGYTTYRLDLKLTSTEKNRQLHQYCRQHKDIFQVQSTIGHMDFETEVAVQDLPELLEIIEDIKRRFGDVVRNVDYFSYSTYHLFNYRMD